MRRILRPLCLLAVLLCSVALWGCSKQWENPDIKDSHEAKVRFDQDSRACDVIAGELHPLDKDRQYKTYSQCMNDRGWVIRDGEYRFNTRPSKD